MIDVRLSLPSVTSSNELGSSWWSRISTLRKSTSDELPRAVGELLGGLAVLARDNDDAVVAHVHAPLHRVLDVAVDDELDDRLVLHAAAAAHQRHLLGAAQKPLTTASSADMSSSAATVLRASLSALVIIDSVL
jgi:hypothetical protein